MSDYEHEAKAKHHPVRIHIDRKPYESPNPTTGSALYGLGHILPGYELFREVEGDHEDRLIPNHEEFIHLQEDEHFYSAEERQREVTIIVNGRQKVVTAKELTFADIVGLAFDNSPSGGNVVFTVTYRGGGGNKPQGTLVQGETVKIKDGMIFNVTATDKS